MLGRQKNRSKFPVQTETAMNVQAQPDRPEKRYFKYQVQNESRQQQADDGDKKTKDVLIETSKEISVERIFSTHEVQVAEKRTSKATSARVKTRASEAGTRDAGSTKNVEAQAEIEEFPHVPFTRNPNFDSPPGMQPPGFPFPMPQYGPLHSVPSQQLMPQYAPPPPSIPSQQALPTASTTTVHTHEHHHHYHQAQKNYKIAYMLPKSGDIRRAKSVDRYEDQEPLGAAVGVQCMSLYERFMNWIYPDNKATEDVSIMTDAGELGDDKKGKKGKKDVEMKSEESEEKDGKKGGSSEADLKAKDAEKKVPAGPPIPVNLPWQGHEYEYEEEIKPDGTRVGTYRYKGLGGAPKAPPVEQHLKPEALEMTTTTTQLDQDGQHFFERQVRTTPMPAGVASRRGGSQHPTGEARLTYRRESREYPPARPPGAAADGREHRSKKPRVVAHQRVKGTEGDNFVPDVQIKLDFRGSSSESSTESHKKSDAWQPADMVVSYAHKNFEDKNMIMDDDDDDDMLPSGNVYGGHGSTKKLIRSRGRKQRGMPNKELMAYSVIVVVAVVGMALLIAMTGHKMRAGQGFGLNHHIVLNVSKFRASKIHGAAPMEFFNAAPGACKDARCLIRGAAAVKHLRKDYLKSACTDFYQFVCSHYKEAESPQLVAQHALEDGILGVIKSNEKYPELMTARQLYKECLNKEAVSERGWDPLSELQEATDLSGWPFTDPVQQPLIWRAAGRLLRRFNLPALLSVGVEKHPHTPGTNIVSVGLPELLLPFNVGNRSLKWYYGAVMHAVSPFRDSIVAPVFAVEVSTFESRLSNIVAPRPSFAVQKLAKHPELAEFLSIVLENITRVTSSTEFLVKDPEYVTQLLSLAKETAPHIVLNYLGFRALVAASPFLPAKVQALSALGRSPALRKQICLGVVVESLPVMSLYAGFNAFKPGVQNFKKANITGATRAAVSSVVKGMSWMDDTTKAKVNKKILSSHLRAFLPAWISEQFKVFVQHEDVPMVIENEGLRSYAAIRRALFENTLKRETAHMEERWLGSILDRECSFDPRGSNIYAPITFWNVSFPTSDNFLMMHMPNTLPKISHCLMTTLLREGDAADNRGDVFSKPMWSNTTKKHFQGIRQCFVKQLSATASKDASTREVISVIGDVAALSSSFKVYKSFVRSKHIDNGSFVKALNMNVNQFFFVSYTLSQCGNAPPTKPSYHSEMTNRDRVNIALKNSPEFQAAFKCPSNHAMNPANKCRLWRRSA